MLNCSYYSIGSGATVTFTDVNGTRTNSRWLGTTYIYGVSAINSTVGSTSYNMPGGSTVSARYVCLDGTLANTMCAITHA